MNCMAGISCPGGRSLSTWIFLKACWVVFGLASPDCARRPDPAAQSTRAAATAVKNICRMVVLVSCMTVGVSFLKCVAGFLDGNLVIGKVGVHFGDIVFHHVASHAVLLRHRTSRSRMIFSRLGCG